MPRRLAVIFALAENRIAATSVDKKTLNRRGRGGNRRGTQCLVFLSDTSAQTSAASALKRTVVTDTIQETNDDFKKTFSTFANRSDVCRRSFRSDGKTPSETR